MPSRLSIKHTGRAFSKKEIGLIKLTTGTNSLLRELADGSYEYYFYLARHLQLVAKGNEAEFSASMYLAGSLVPRRALFWIETKSVSWLASPPN